MKTDAFRLSLLCFCLCVFALHATATTYYVDINSPSPTPPYTSWSTAATDIQSAINQTTNGDLVLVNPGVYGSSGYAAPDAKLSCVVVTNAITLSGVDGSTVTTITGSNAMRCIFLGDSSTMTGFTLANGFVGAVGGGGVCCVSTDVTVSSCLLVSNNAAGGGGAYSGTFSYCVFCANIDRLSGGGANDSVLNNCLLVGNVAELGGGGASSCILNNCTISNNWTPISYEGGQTYGGGAANCVMSNCFVTGNYEAAGGFGGGVYECRAYSCLISNNWADNGGGAAGVLGSSTPCALINCTLIDNVATNAYGKDQGPLEGGGAYGCYLTNCVIEDNSITNSAGGTAEFGGGVEDSVLDHCLLISNSVYVAEYGTQYTVNSEGGGADSSTLNHCQIYWNFTTNNAEEASSGGGLSGCTAHSCIVSSNSAYGGGGVYESTLNGCSVTGNSAYSGGGAYQGILYDCLIVGNIAGNNGGAYEGTLVNCTVVENTETNPFTSGDNNASCGGVAAATLKNCIVYYNYAQSNNYANFVPAAGDGPVESLSYCCTFPAPPSGKNITNAPDFIDLVNGNFRLQTNSPCINAGNNSYVTNRVDLDGRPRIVGGTVDMGAYEFQGPGIGEFIAYLQQYGLPTDGSVDFADLDGTAFNVYQDWIAGLNPTNPASILAMLTPVSTNNTAGIKVTWQSVPGIPYLLQRSTNLLSQPPFSTIQSNIAGQVNTTSYTDSSATNNVPYFYRVGVIAP